MKQPSKIRVLKPAKLRNEKIHRDKNFIKLKSKIKSKQELQQITNLKIKKEQNIHPKLGF